MSDRKLTTHLLILADNDDFQTSLHMLLTSSSLSSSITSKTTKKGFINLNRRTTGGDYLVTLSAYAACEKTLKMQSRIYALKCLCFILEHDFTAVNKIAGDGGSALHSALAAASCYCLDEINDDQYDGCDSFDDNSYDSEGEDEDEEEDEDSFYEDEEDDKEERGIDKEFLNELKVQARNGISIMDKYYSKFNNLTSDEIVMLTIRLLISNDADINLPLANVHTIKNFSHSSNHNNENDEVDDEIELAYSKEAVIQEWTPLMFASQMVVFACSRSSSHKNHEEEDEERTSNKDDKLSSSLAVSILIFQTLLSDGADPSYMMASSRIGHGEDWNLHHILASSSYILKRKELYSTDIIETIHRLHQRSLQHLAVVANQENNTLIASQKDCVEAVEENIAATTVYDYLNMIIAKYTTETGNDNYTLSPLQSFTKAIMMNDTHSALSILDSIIAENKSCSKNDIDGGDDEARTDQMKKWRLIEYSSVFPLLQSSWDNDMFSGKTIFNIASYCLAIDSIKLLLGNEGLETLSEAEMRSNIQSVFLNCDHNSENDELTHDQVTTLFVLLGMEEGKQGDNITTTYDVNFAKKRQRILDRLLLESCSKTPWAQKASNSSTLALILLGADPNVDSIVDKVQHSLSPLHLVAGNIRGMNGVQKVDYLLGRRKNVMRCHLPKSSKPILRANLIARAGVTNATPMQIALEKRNFHVVKRLYEETMDNGDSPSNVVIHDMVTQWSMDKAKILGEAAIQCASVDLFQTAVKIMKELFIQHREGGKEVESNIQQFGRALGKLLLWAVDERSGFSIKGRSSATRNSDKDDENNIDDDQYHKLKKIVDIISDIQIKMPEVNNIPSWARDEISGHTPLHCILRSDRSKTLRVLLLHPLCTILSRDYSCLDADFISLKCSEKFGSYTALHLACALGCEESVRTLLDFNADTTVVSGDDNQKPIDMIPDTSCFSDDTMIALNSRVNSK